jgi:hypothetical protein
MTIKKRVTILGSTGSVGQTALRLMADHPDDFDIFALVADSNVDLLAQDARRFGATFAVLADPLRYNDLKNALILSLRLFRDQQAWCPRTRPVRMPAWWGLPTKNPWFAPDHGLWNPRRVGAPALRRWIQNITPCPVCCGGCPRIK